MASGFVGLIAFHVLGNAAALVLSLPRRPIQAMLLAGFGALTVYGQGRHWDVRRVTGGSATRWLVCVLAGWGAFLAARWALMNGPGAEPSVYAVEVALIAPLWLAFAARAVRPWRVAAPSPMPPPSGFGFVVMGLLGLLASVAYTRGPEPRDVMMTFGGSTIQAGAAAAALGGVALVTLRGWQRAVGLTLAMYLVFVATSRAGVVLLLALFAAHVASAALGGRRMGRLVREWAGSSVLFVLCGVLVVLLARGSFFFPYLSSRPAQVRVEYPHASLTEWDAFVERFGRLRRPVSVDVGRSSSGLIEGLRSADTRWVLVLDTVKVLAANPWGYWPRPFEEVAPVRCGRPPVCAYPHNLLLDVGFHFGWVPLAILAGGLVVCGVRAVATLAGGSLPARVAAVGFLAYLGVAQLSGDLVDSLYPLGFGAAWLIARAASGKGATTSHARAGERT